MRRVVLSVMAAAALCACTLLTSLDELYEGSPDAGPQVPSEAGSSETSVDSSLPDAAVGDADADAPPIPFCKSVTGFAICADFDDSNLPPFPFDSVSLNGASNTLTYDSADSKSPPRSLYMTGGSSSSITATGLVWKTPPITVSQEVVAELDVKVEQRGTRPFDLLQFTRASHDLSIEVAANGNLQFDYELPDGDGGTLNGTVNTSGTATGAWQHLKWSAKKDTGSRFKVEVSVDGVPIGATTINQTLFVGQPSVEIGDTALEASTTLWKVRMDNIVVYVK